MCCDNMFPLRRILSFLFFSEKMVTCIAVRAHAQIKVLEGVEHLDFTWSSEFKRFPTMKDVSVVKCNGLAVK
jgi:hypothetical protein